MAAVLDAHPIVAGLRGLFSRDVGRQALLTYAAEKIQTVGDAIKYIETNKSA